jgi:hypothetical protein
MITGIILCWYLITCVACGVREMAAAEKKKQFKICGGCKEFHYCSVECQTDHWPVHKSYCLKKTANIKNNQSGEWHTTREGRIDDVCPCVLQRTVHNLTRYEQSKCCRYECDKYVYPPRSVWYTGILCENDVSATTHPIQVIFCRAKCRRKYFATNL